MRYLIVADWDESFHVTRSNTVDTEENAQALVNRLINELPVAKRAPNSFYVEMPAKGWDIKYVVVDPSTKTITYSATQESADTLAQQFKYLRDERNHFLEDTDWVSIRASDAGTEIPSDWKTYRQALRDLPANTPDPANPTWPVAPA